MSHVLELSCGGIHEGQNGTFTSYNYEQGYYPSNVECVWTIRAPEGSKIVLNHTFFDVHHSDGCSMDYVKVSFFEK